MARKPLSDNAVNYVLDSVERVIDEALVRERKRHEGVLAHFQKDNQLFSERMQSELRNSTSVFMKTVLDRLAGPAQFYGLSISEQLVSDSLRKQLTGKNEKLCNQRIQLQNLQEKLELMKTWRGIFRTVGQRLGLCR